MVQYGGSEGRGWRQREDGRNGRWAKESAVAEKRSLALMGSDVDDREERRRGGGTINIATSSEG
jgi:hypothetical protein